MELRFRVASSGTRHQGNTSVSYMPQPSTCSCRLPGLKPAKLSAGFQGNSSYSYIICSASTFPNSPQAACLKAAGLQGNNSYSYSMPCHLFFKGFKTAVCPPSNPLKPQNPPAGLQGNNSYSYMPPSVFQGVQATTLTAIHAPAICFSGGSRLPFARPQTPQTLPTLPQASKATTLTATCPCHLFFRGFKTAVCPPSHPPNASNALAGLRLKPSKRFCRPPRQQLLQLHVPAICFSRGSRLPFARPQTPQTLPTLPQASKATTLTATCPCHLFFKGFKTAVCPPSNPPNASNAPAGLQGNNSYSYMSLPSVFPGVQDCRLPALKPPKPFQRFRRPPRQQLLQLLHAPAICFSGGSRLPFARPHTPQTLPTLPQASKATTLTSTTCPCHLFFRGFKTAVCPPSNPPNPSNASAGLQGNNSYSYMPRPSVFQGVQATTLTAIHAPAICFSGGSRLPFARPQTPQTLPTLPQASKATTLTATTCPCHLFFQGVQDCRLPALKPPNPSNAPAGLQGNNSYSYMPLPSAFQGVQDCRLPALKPPKPFQRSRRPPRQQLLQLLHAPAICFFRAFKTAVCPPSNPPTLPTLPQASKATTLTATCPCHLLFKGFKTAVCPPSHPPNASNAPAGLRLKPSKRFRRPPRQQLLQLHVPAICFSGGSRLPFARPQTPQTLPTLPQASKATTLTATCPCHLFFRTFKTAVCPASNRPNASEGLQGNNSYSYFMPLPSVFPGVQDCRLPALKPPKPFQRFRRPPSQQLLQLLHAPAICFSGGSRLPFARPQTPQTLPTLPQASKATTLTATTCPCHLFFRGFKTAVCPPSNPPNPSNASAGLQGNNSYSYYMPLPSVFQGVQDCRLPALKPPKRFQRSRRPPSAFNAPAGLQGNNSYSYMPLPSLFQGVQNCRLPALKTPQPFQRSRRPPPQPSKRFRMPPRQQLLQLLHAPAICFFRGFKTAVCPQTLPTLPQASKATTLTAATCPGHLFFRGFKTAVCPPSNPPNPSNAPTGLQGNNSYSYMPLPSVFSGGSRLPFARPPTPQTLPTLPQASKATTLTATTCPCHLFFRGFKTAVCPPSNPPNPSNASAGLQGNNSYSYYMPLPSVFQGVQDCRLPALKPPKPFQRFRRPPRQQLLQLLHAPALCPKEGGVGGTRALAHSISSLAVISGGQILRPLEPSSKFDDASAIYACVWTNLCICSKRLERTTL